MTGRRNHQPLSVYLCHHARTPLSAQGVLRGYLDPTLDAAGRAEAEALGSSLGSLGPARVASPPTRAVQTAQAIAAHAGIG